MPRPYASNVAARAASPAARTASPPCRRATPRHCSLCATAQVRCGRRALHPHDMALIHGHGRRRRLAAPRPRARGSDTKCCCHTATLATSPLSTHSLEQGRRRKMDTGHTNFGGRRTNAATGALTPKSFLSLQCLHDRQLRCPQRSVHGWLYSSPVAQHPRTHSPHVLTPLTACS